MYAHLVMHRHQYLHAARVLWGPTQAQRDRRLAVHAMEANTRPESAYQYAPTGIVCITIGPPFYITIGVLL